MRKGGFAAIGAIILGTAGPAAAQGIPVYESSGYLQALATVKNTLSMIEPGQEPIRSGEHTSELQSLMRHSYGVLCLKKNTSGTEAQNGKNTPIDGPRRKPRG